MRQCKEGPAARPAHAAYDAAFYARQVDGSLQSARVVVPLLMELARPSSVIDLGCGCGAWLRAFQEAGVGDLRGLDGSWVAPSELLVEAGCFTVVDLCNPGRPAEGYDLALCLEVGEHLPGWAAPGLVQALTAAAPLVLFSAAVPGQGGTRHVNEQWPGYWQALFARHGYRRLDPVRRKILCDSRVEWWYRQNLFLYASPESIRTSPRLQEEERFADENPLIYLHADILASLLTLRGLLRVLPGAVWRAFRRVARSSCAVNLPGTGRDFRKASRARASGLCEPSIEG